MSRLKFWNKVAPMYDNFMKKSDYMYDEVSDIICKYLSCNYKVLELACGTGQLSFRLSGSVEKYLATDFSNKMIDVCKKKYSTNQIDFEVADATNLTYKDNSFDIVIIANALHCIPNSKKVLSEIKRVLKQNGLLIAPTFIRDGSEQKFRLGVLRLIGFKTYNYWTKEEFELFIRKNKFQIIHGENVNGKPLTECVLIAKNIV